MKRTTPRNEDEPAGEGLLDAALEIASRRAETLRQIRDLFLEGKDSKATALTKQFLGITPDRRPQSR